MKLCPICTLVSGSWLTLLVYRAAGYAVDPALIATLMGGSAVGITYLLERRLPPKRSAMWFKLVLIPPLLVSVYGIAVQWFAVATGALVVALVIIALFFRRGSTSDAQRRAITDAEKKLENCC